MAAVNTHLRRMFLAGVFAAVPIAITAIIVWYIETQTRQVMVSLTGRNIPFLGVVLAVVLIYLAGVLVSSLIGQYILNTVDRLLIKLPGLGDIYRVWKQVALTPAGTLGMYARVVLVRDETGSLYYIGFTSGQPIPGDTDTVCVFVPNYPNPVVGRLYFVPASLCLTLDTTVDEAFKAIVSGGNYLPETIGRALNEKRQLAAATNRG
jgi:uncharacterized membrane protein